MEMEITISGILRSLFRHIILVVVLPIIVAGLAAFYCWSYMPDTYSASTTLYVISKADPEYANTGSTNYYYSPMTEDYMQLLTSRRVKSAAQELIGLDENAPYSVSIQETNTDRMFAVRVSGENPATAANYANALAVKLSDCILDVAYVENINIIDEAVPSVFPSGPNRLKYVAIAALAAFVVACVIAFLVENIHMSIKTKDDVSKILGLQVLASIPYEENADRKK